MVYDDEIAASLETGTTRTSLLRLTWTSDGRELALADVVRAWRERPHFGSWFSAVLASAPFEAFFWECPPTTAWLAARAPFECTLVRAAGGFRRASPDDFSEHLQDCGKGAVSFPNIGRNAMLIAPCLDPEVPMDAFGHIAAFCRRASRQQQDNFWKEVATTLEATLDQRGPRKPTWLSTAGEGVPWLHVRLDSRPKYYKTDAYRVLPQMT